MADGKKSKGSKAVKREKKKDKPRSTSRAAAAQAYQLEQDKSFLTTSRRSKQTGESMLNKVIECIIKDCQEHDPHNIFRYAVDKKLALGYYTAIAQPICLEEMSQKAKRQEYSTIEAFKDDMRLLRCNAEQYNGVHNAIAQAARDLEAVAENASTSTRYR